MNVFEFSKNANPNIILDIDEHTSSMNYDYDFIIDNTNKNIRLIVPFKFKWFFNLDNKSIHYVRSAKVHKTGMREYTRVVLKIDRIEENDYNITIRVQDEDIIMMETFSIRVTEEIMKDIVIA